MADKLVAFGDVALERLQHIVTRPSAGGSLVAFGDVALERLQLR